MVWTEVHLDGHTDLYAFPRGSIMSARHRSDILEPIVRSHASANGDAFIYCKIMRLPTLLRCPRSSLMTHVSE